ncbi:FUSC family protein [Caballeronia sp. KNU42]
MSIAASLCSLARGFHRARVHRSATRGAVSPSSRLLTRLLGSDPGLLRFHTALRSAIACVLTGVVTIGWTVHTDQPPTLAGFALLFAMVAPLFLRDASPRDWFRSLAVIYGAGSASLIAASTLAAWPLVADAAFLAVLFAAMLVQACGPRALGGAMTAVVSFYLGLYLHPALAHVVAMLGLSTIALACVAFTARVLVPTRPEATLRRALAAVMQRATTVLADRRADEPNAMRHLSLLNEAALAVEEQLGLLDLPGVQRLRACLIDVEVAAGQHAVDSSRLDRSDVRLRVALRRLSRAGRDAVASTARAARTAVKRTGVKRSTGAALAWRDALSWLPACRATTAALIAMLIGHSVSPERWFWAVITTFVVFLGTRSRGDTIRKTGERVLGTLAGVAVSAALVGALHGTPWLLVVAMAACVFGWAYFILTLYGQGVFFITVLVGLIYGELGFAIGPLIEMRVEEVFVGCVVSIAVAVSMMPLRTSHHVDVKVTGVLDALDEVLRVCNTSVDVPGHHSLTAMRALDRRWHELRVALRPLQTQRVFAWNPQMELAVGPLFACVQAARELASETARGAAVVVTDEARARLAGAMVLFAARSGRHTGGSDAAHAGEFVAAR